MMKPLKLEDWMTLWRRQCQKDFDLTSAFHEDEIVASERNKQNFNTGNTVTY